MHYLANYGLFLAKILTWVISLFILTAGFIALVSRGKERQKDEITINIEHLNTQWETQQKLLQKKLLPKKAYQKWNRQQPAKSDAIKPRVFVLNFNGDIKATAVVNLREEITALLGIATPADEVVLRLESAGGIVHGYGLAASQLARIRAKQIPLTIIIDKVAASGGYLMACVAHKILAAPFAIIGSIGVVAQLPNFHRWLQKHAIDFEQITAGQYKRTLTLFGENDPEKREKMQHALEEIHAYFKYFIQQNRPQVLIEQVATGEHWLASKALDLHLIDGLTTSDDYLYNASRQSDVFMLTSRTKQTLKTKLSAWFAHAALLFKNPTHF